MAGEYKGDFTRDTNYVFKHFSRVLMQQGRVQLDADWNEQAAILLDLLRGLGADAIGPFARVDDGFVLKPLQVPTDPPNVRDFVISPGDCYVDGVLCRMEGTPIPFASTDNPLKVLVSEWLVDGVPFQEGQYIEVIGGTPPQSRITEAEPNTRTLTLNARVTLAGDPPPPTFRLRRLTTFRTQPDYPSPQERDQDLQKLESGTPSKNYLVYLDVWERHITYVEEGAIREIALGGPDTATRAQVVSQVKIAFDSAASNFSETKDPGKLHGMLADQFQPYNRGWLRARTKPAPDPHLADACITHPDARYRGAENQLYRVEIHKGVTRTDKTATFKWSRENASVIFPILSLTGSEVLLETLGRDSRFGLKVDDWVEILDDHLLLQGQPGSLLQVSEVSVPDRRVVLKGSGGPPTIKKDDPDHPHAFLRRWDHKDTSGNGISLVEVPPDGAWIDLEDGIQIQFQPGLSPVSTGNTAGGNVNPPQNVYRTGDYWLIPARTAANGVIDWPVTKDDMKTVPIALPPHGIDHHYAPLGLITVPTADGQVAVGTQFIQPLNKSK